MPYDPRQMLQIGQLGLGMMSPQQGNPFAQVQRPKQWWEQPMPAGRSAQTDQPQQNDPSKPLAPEKPPSLLEMLMSLNRLRSPSDRAAADRSPSDRAPASQASPWGWLGSMGMPGGPGWGGGGVR